MTKWEHKLAIAYSAVEIEAVLNTLGQEGWELVNATIQSLGLAPSWICFFKRPAVDSEGTRLGPIGSGSP